MLTLLHGAISHIFSVSIRSEGFLEGRHLEESWDPERMKTSMKGIET
jgi:hypothetical protein